MQVATEVANISKNAMPESFEQTYKEGLGTGRVITRARKGDGFYDVETIESQYFVEDPPRSGQFMFDETKLTVNKAWYDPIQNLWLVFQDTDGDGRANGEATGTFIDVLSAQAFLKQQKNQTPSSNIDQNDNPDNITIIPTETCRSNKR